MSRGQGEAGFSLARIHSGEWLAGLFGLALIAGLLLPWNGGEAAMESPGLLDLLLALAGALAAILPVVVGSSPRTNVPIVYETFLWVASLLLGLIMVIKVAFPPDDGYESGFWLALAATLLIGVSLWRSVGRES